MNNTQRNPQLPDELAPLPEDEFEVSESFPKKETAIAMALLFAFVPVGYLTESTRVLWGARYQGMSSLADMAIYGAFYLALFHAMLTWPVTSLAYKRLEQFESRFMRLLAVVLLTAPPLMSYSYYRGGVAELLDLHEMALMVLPPAITAAVLYDRFRRPMLLTLILGGSTYISLFLLNDVMTPFMTYFSYASSSAWHYWLRSALPLAGVCYAFWIARSEEDESRAGLLGFLCYTVVTQYLVPAIIAVKDKMPLTKLLLPDFAWVGAILGLWLMSRPTVNPRLLNALFGLECLYFLAKMGALIRFGETAYWHLSAFSYAACGFAMFATLLAKRVTTPLK